LRFAAEPPLLDFENHGTFTGNDWSSPEIDRNTDLGRISEVPPNFPRQIYPLGVDEKNQTQRHN
jgi:hypothetical protein